MPIGFTKSFFIKASGKQSSIDTSEVNIATSRTDSETYAEKVSVSGLTFEQMNSMYLANVWVRACIDKIVNRVAEIEPIVKPVKSADPDTGKLSDATKKNMEKLSKILSDPNESNEGFGEIRKKLVRDVLKYDAGAIEMVKSLSTGKDGNKVEIYSVPGNTIKINVDEKGKFKDDNRAYLQVDRNRKVVTSWDKDKLMYFILNPQSDRVYGLAPAESLVQTVTAELYSSTYNLDFFYNNATPRFAIMMDKVGLGQGAPAVERFRTFWDQELKGKPHRPIILAAEDGSIKIEKMGLSNDEMQFQEYSRWLLSKIMVIYNMQPTIMGLIDVNMGKLNSQEQTKLFKQDAVKPHLTMMIEKLNQKVIFAKNGLGLSDVYLDFDVDLADKVERAKWHETYMRSGVLTINEIRVQGLGLQPVPWGGVPYLQNNLVPFGQEGAALPATPAQAISQAPEETSQIPSALIGKNALKKYLSDGSGWPVGWEDDDPDKRLEIIEKLIMLREKELAKRSIIPKSITLEME